MQRMCLCCLEDVTDSLDQSLCSSCEIETELHRNATGDWNGRSGNGEWWGLTRDDVEWNDIKEGFYVSSTDGKDSELTWADAH